MGTSHSVECNETVFEIWSEAIKGDYFISTTHIPGKFNANADKESRRKESSMEWMLNPEDFRKIIKLFSILPDMDLFASRLNYQIKPFVSFRPDPESAHVNSYLISWSNFTFYAFPPFNQVCKTLMKIHMDKASGILVVPNWPNQLWFTRAKQMAKNIILLPPRKNLLILPSSNLIHPLHKSLSLLALLI